MRGLLFVVLCSFLISLKSTDDRIVKGSFDAQRLEVAILNGVNAARIDHGVQTLQTNAILYKAAQDQAIYIAKKESLSHKQPSPEKAKARDRVEFYGGNMRGIGENTAFIKVLTPAIFKGENGKIDTLTITTYAQAAEYMVYAWLNSSAHKTNMLFDLYEYSGLKVVYNEESDALYSVQVFGFDYSE